MFDWVPNASLEAAALSAIGNGINFASKSKL